MFAKGLRNAVGLKWIGDALYLTNQGSDHLGLQKPDETFYRLQPPAIAGGTDKSGDDYGWPYCHSSDGRIFADPQIKRPGGCANVVAPHAYFPARSSAMGFDFFDDERTPEPIKNAFLVALHGSTSKATGSGYKIAVMRKDARLRDFITGFLQGGKVMGRPCDIMKLSPDSFLFTDDDKGVVYYVRSKGSRALIKPDAPGDTDIEAVSVGTGEGNQKPNRFCGIAVFAGAFLLKLYW